MKENIVQLLAVSFVALITGFVLGLSVSMPLHQGEQYAYGSVLIDDQPGISDDARRKPMTNRLAILNGLREHGSADLLPLDEDFATAP